MKQLEIYTDGSGTTGGDAGWAFVSLEGPEDEIVVASGFLEDATNNVAEMMAITRAIEYAIHYHVDRRILIKSDSAYVVNAFNDGWLKNWLDNGWKNKRKKPVANREYWEYLLELEAQIDISFEHVLGHNGNIHNELADELCKKARIEREGV